MMKEMFFGGMFENSLIVLAQIAVMFLIMILGFYVFRKGMLDNETIKRLSGFLNRYVMPCAVIRSFQRPFDAELARTFGLTMICAMLTFVIAIAIANAVYRPSGAANYADRRVCIILTNDGFMALPLLAAMFGPTGVFLGAAHICCMTVVLWTYGVKQLSHGREKMTLRNAVLHNPGVIAAVLGLLLFVSPVKLPAVAFTAVDLVGDLNTPLAMICLGCFIAQVDLKACFFDRALWVLSGLRLLVIPVLVMVPLLFVPLDPTAKLCLMVGVSAPSAIACAMFSQVHGADFLFSTRAITLTTILSIVTLPGMIAVMESLMRVVG